MNKTGGKSNRSSPVKKIKAALISLKGGNTYSCVLSEEQAILLSFSDVVTRLRGQASRGESPFSWPVEGTDSGIQCLRFEPQPCNTLVRDLGLVSCLM